MPRRSPYQIVLSKIEHDELESRARRSTSPYAEVVRAKIVSLRPFAEGEGRVRMRVEKAPDGTCTSSTARWEPRPQPTAPRGG